MSMPAVASGCHLLAERMARDTGGHAVPCDEGIACANDAFRQKKPFTLCHGGWGMDSHIETGVAGLANGNVLFYYLDTFGPHYRGTCLRTNVSLAAAQWPECRTALLDQMDLATGKPLVEAPPLPTEEAWPRSCADRALQAARRSYGVRLITGQNPLPNPEQFGYRCRDAVVFEMLIDKTGRVECTRVISVGLRPRVPAAYDLINARLMRWRFEPPTIHGEPVDVLWGMQINPIIHKGESIPGPPIYPVCP